MMKSVNSVFEELLSDNHQNARVTKHNLEIWDNENEQLQESGVALLDTDGISFFNLDDNIINLLDGKQLIEHVSTTEIDKIHSPILNNKKILPIALLMKVHAVIVVINPEYLEQSQMRSKFQKNITKLFYLGYDPIVVLTKKTPPELLFEIQNWSSRLLHIYDFTEMNIDEHVAFNIFMQAVELAAKFVDTFKFKSNRAHDEL